jgi:hypothetical protein
MKMCERGEQVSKKCENKVIVAGEPTALYWHIHTCEECAEKRDGLSNGKEQH